MFRPVMVIQKWKFRVLMIPVKKLFNEIIY